VGVKECEDIFYFALKTCVERERLGNQGVKGIILNIPKEIWPL
jgi:hypothetical protein